MNKLLISLFLALLLIGCASAPTPLIQSVSVEDYCTGVGDYVYHLSEQVGDYNRNNEVPADRLVVKEAMNGEVARTVKDMPPRELQKIMDMVDFVFDHPDMTPTQAAKTAYALCVSQRTDNTWFK